MPPPKKPWEPEWSIEEELDGGGQGATFKVTRTANGVIGVLKRLRQQDDPERRRRMHREVTILQTLEHAGIPKLLASNSHEFATNHNLYLITDFIPGSTVSALVERSALSIVDASALILQLLDILTYAHAAGMIHRDIKPDNVILKDDDFHSPMLIDFGLSFNEAEEANSSLTNSVQQLGNRFITLPELQLKSSLQRDSRSDLTQLVGVFFYALTGVFPMALTDAVSQLPHQRENAASSLGKLPDDIKPQISRIFDRGFAVPIDQRWQSADELRHVIKQLTDTSRSQTTASELTFAELGARLQDSTQYTRLSSIRKKAETILNAHSSVVKAIGVELGPEFSISQGGLNIDMATLKFRNTMGVTHNLFRSCKFRPRMEGEVTGNEIVMYSNHDGEHVEFARFPISQTLDVEPFKNAVREFYRSGVARVIESNA